MASLVQSASFIYGTAWKREETAVLTSRAIQSGFICFDTANQPKHYREDLVGEAIREAFMSGIIKNRADIYACFPDLSEKFNMRISLTISQIQTKFSRSTAQDPLNAPYSMDAPLEEQIHASIQKSLQNLRHNDIEESRYIDTLILHSPYPDFADTLRAWHVFSSYVPHLIRALGISNVPFPILKQLYDTVETKPTRVQVRFHPESAFEVPMHQFCAEKGIVFQAHKVLKGNKALIESDLLGDIAGDVGVSREMALYLCVMGLPGSIRVVNGTKNQDHMREDLDSLRNFEQWSLNPDHRTSWHQKMLQFKTFIGDQS